MNASQKMTTTALATKALLLFATAFAAQSAMAAPTTYKWRTCTGGQTDGQLDAAKNYIQNAVPPESTSLCEFWYSQSSAFTLTNNLKTGTYYLRNITGGSGKRAAFDLAPYTLTFTPPSGYQGLNFVGTATLDPSWAALTSGTMSGTVLFGTSKSGGKNVFDVDGANAVLKAWKITFEAKLNRLAVLNGGTVNGMFDIGGNSNTIRISGEGSAFVQNTNSNGPRIGSDGKGNRFEVLDGGMYSNNNTTAGADLNIGYNVNSSTWKVRAGGNNAVLVSNATFKVLNREIRLGYNSSSNTFDAVDGAKVTAKTLTLGYVSASGQEGTTGGITYGNRVLVADTETSLNATDVTVGRYSSDANRLTVTNGATMRVSNNLSIGDRSSSNELVVAGGAQAQVVKTITMGNNSYLGSGVRTSGNRILITGEDSVLKAETLKVGNTGTDRNSVIVTNGATLNVSTLYAGADATQSNLLYVARGSTLNAGYRLYIGDGGQSKYNRVVLDGVSYTHPTAANAYTWIGRNGGSYNELELVNGAKFTHVISKGSNQPMYVGNGNGTGNRIRVASGSTLTCSFLDVGYKATGSNVLELDNGFYQSQNISGQALSYCYFDRDVTANSWLILKGTNSYFNCFYSQLSKVRFEIPSQGLADVKNTQAVCSFGYVNNGPNEVVVDVDGKCPGGKWLLAEWSNSAMGLTAEQFIAMTTLTGEGASRAKLIADGKKVYLKMRGNVGFSVFIR